MATLSKNKKSVGGKAATGNKPRSLSSGEPSGQPDPPASFPTIAKVVVEGNRKIELDAILAHMKLQAGRLLDPAQVREDIQSLFKTGYFYDIQVYKEGPADAPTLLVQVVEKPSVAEVIFDGNSEVKADELKDAAGLKSFEILNMTKVRDAVEKIQKLYEDKGYFLAKAEPIVQDIKAGETVKLTFKITENEKVKVKKITILGNHKLKDGYLKGRLATTEGGFFSFMSGSGSYKQDAFDRDMQILRILYFNEGYIQVKIDRPQVYVTPDKKSIYITIRVEEGEQYYVGEIDFSGDLLFPRQELADAIEINKREVFSWEVLQKDLSILQAKYGDLGYAFANVIPRNHVNEKERKMDVTFEFDKGNKVYFGEFNVIGNSKTRDKVVRRELKIREGELYNETRKRESQENVQRLGFFEDVNFKTSTPPEHPDLLNIDISVKERNTGSIQLGAGYGSATAFTLTGQINQANFLGKGQKLSAGVNISNIASLYNLNFTDSYFMDTEWTLGFDAYKSQTNRNYYIENKLGGAFRFGHPLGEYLFGTVRYRLDRADFSTISDLNGVLITDPTLFPLSSISGITSSITGILEYDRRNDRINTSKGFYASASLEYAGIGGDIQYTKGVTTARYFSKLFWELVWRNNLSYSFITSHNSTDPPFNELFLLGGPYSLRGYDWFRIGRTQYSSFTYDYWRAQGKSYDDATRLAYLSYGGRQQVLYQTEFEFPLIAEAGIKGVLFYDVGEAEDVITSDAFYSDIGFGFRWISPIGPLRFEWGFPLRPTDLSPRPAVFEFSIGNPF
ncbi:MAG: outer membrane protein assembly factor BamA [Bdellovibrio sp.]|nr:MAG: outer membrane protein assembly factor BamA [Bdellovibrio sp.]